MSWRGPPTPPGKNRARPAEIFRTARRNLKLQKEEDDADDGNLMGTWPGRAAAPAAKRAVGAGRRSSRHFLNHCFRYISRVSEPYSCSETPYRHSYHFWRDYRRSFIWSYFIHGTLMYLGAFVSRQPTYSLWFYRWCGRDDAWIPPFIRRRGPILRFVLAIPPLKSSHISSCLFSFYVFLRTWHWEWMIRANCENAKGDLISALGF